MAISQAMSNPSDRWSMQMYQTNFSDISQPETPPNTTATTTGAATSTASGSSRNNNLSPDIQGRVSKPAPRRRSRASRRTPTTLLNTDTTNFRAMVQQFTGGPSTRSQFSGGGATFSFNSTNSAVAAPRSGFQVVYPNEMMQQQHMFMMNNMHGGSTGGVGAAAGVPPSQARPGSSPVNENRNYDNFMLR